MYCADINSDVPVWLKNVSGNYIVFIDGNCLYIGESKNLQERLKSHFQISEYSNWWKTKWGRFRKAIVVVRKEKKQFERLMIEAQMIKRLKPQKNILKCRAKRWLKNEQRS